MLVFPHAALALALAAALTASLPTAASAQVGTTVTTPSGMKMTDTVVGRVSGFRDQPVRFNYDSRNVCAGSVRDIR